MKIWYLIMAKPKQDELAETHLKNQQYEVYRPKLSVQKTRRGKSVNGIQSLFPRYLFVLLDDENQDWGPIRSTKGVMQMVRFGLKPAKVDQSLIEALQQRERLQLNDPEAPWLQKGQKLRVEQGPFYGLEGVFESYDADQRVVMLMNLLGQKQKVALKASQVEKSE